MGQGYSSAAVADGNLRAGIDIRELSDISYEKSLGTARFLKTIRAKHSDGLVVVKIFAKPLPNFSLEEYHQQVQREQDVLEAVPNALAYQRVVETERAAYLVRQYLYSSLYDRISTRPFLEDIERRWIAFQLLCGLRDSHARNVHHGDIKTENVLVTSWNWIYLSDFAPFKPTFLPEDNPADFSYYFDTSGRRICYIAPERFTRAGEGRGEGKLTDQMDIFSLGCVIAELFLDGTPLFTLSQLFKYRTGEYDPAQTYLGKIEDPDIKSLVQHMINLDPSQRLSAEQYLSGWRKKAFPDYFYSFLHQYIGFITDPATGHGSSAPGDLSGRADERIEKLYYDFDKISFFLGFEQNQESDAKRTSIMENIVPVHLDIPNYQRNSSLVRKRSIVSDDGTLIFLSLVASSLRNTSRATARVRACEIILAFGERIRDEAKMDRCIPYLVNLLNDECIIVKVAAIRTITQLMELIEVISPINSHIFREYILPKMQNCVTNGNTLVRATYASCLASLANSASRFLDMTQALRTNGVLPTADPEAEVGSDTEAAFLSLYDTSKNDLLLYFQEHAKLLLTDGDSAVRRAFLRSITRLCIFFGSTKANDIVLSHLNTYLNDKDWMLRCAFFETIVGVAAYVGGTALEEYIMPLMVQSLTDPEEFVVERVLKALANMAALGLFQREKIWELLLIVGPFTMHPNIWIREGAAAFIDSALKWLSPADIHSIAYPSLQRFLKTKIIDLSALNILENLQKPLSRNVFDMAVTWASKTKDSLLWQGAQVPRNPSLSSSNESIWRPGGREMALRTPKGSEDERWVLKLRSLGMGPEDEHKLIALREYILIMSRSKPLLSDSANSLLNSTISLQNMKITPQTIFFDENESFFHFKPLVSPSNNPPKPTNVADALLDASKSIDKAPKRNSSTLQLRRVTSDLQRARSNPGSGSSTPVQVDGKSIVAAALPVPSGNTNGDSDSSTATSSVDNGPKLKQRPSMVNLLHRGIDTSKAIAETSTVSATAFGKVEQPFSKDVEEPLTKITDASEDPFRFRAAHTYDGNDPHILKLLDSTYLQNYPSDIVEFGPVIAPIVPVDRRQPIRKSTGRMTGGTWKPEGVLVAQFGEHQGAINRIVVAPDHNFFVTGSDDGTVKIWDASRLEKNVAFKARQTYTHGKNVKVKALCFVENTRCFVSAATDGSVRVVKVDFQTTAAKYGKLRVLRNWQLPDGEYAVWMEHFKADAHSILLIATNASNVHALDLRAMQILYTLQNPVHHGTPTCFCIDRKHNWLVLGTSHGILDMWDLRFQLRLKAWGLPGSTPIHRLSVHPWKGRNKWIIVAGGTGQGELSVWDCEKTQCREVYRAGGGKDSGKGYESWNVDDESSEDLLERFASTLNHLEPGGSGNVDRGVRAFVAGLDMYEDMDSKMSPGFIISAGADRKIRFWNCIKVESSMVVSGLDTEEQKPTYTSSHPTPTLTLNTERVTAAERETNPSVNSRNNAAATSSQGSGRKSKPTGRTPRSTVISMQQQQLLKSHLDSVLDVAFLEVPYGMIISVDRSGIALVYQ